MSLEQVIEKLNELSGIKNIEVIPGGGQSYAFSAFDTILDRKIFLKVYWYSEKYKESLLFEPRKLTNLYTANENCRNHIVNVFSTDIITVDSEKYIVLRMEYCEGQNLKAHIGSYGLSIMRCISLAKDICEGIHYLHSACVVHRDIKPENIMISNSKVKIVDLGSVMDMGSSEWKSVTSTKTLFYNPPEVYQDDRKYGKASDIFQIGAVLYEMIYGCFDITRIPPLYLKRSQNKLGLSCSDTWEKCQIENFMISDLLSKGKFYEMITLQKDYVPKELIRFVKKITSYNADDRYRTCADVRIALSRLNIPDWQQVSLNSYYVTDWRGKDYSITIVDNVVNCRVSIAGKNSFRQIKSIKSMLDAINEING